DPAIVTVDKSSNLRLFSPSAQKVLNLTPAHIGMPITSIKMGISVENLEKILSKVIADLSIVNQEVRDSQGRFFDMRVRPYITQDGRIDGAVLSFVDVDAFKKAERMASIGETAGMVGHDIRNPLQAITSDVYLLQSDLESYFDSEEKKTAMESLKEIQQNVDYI